MKNLFIDSNVWLSLYHFTNDDLEQFGKLKKLIGADIMLYIPHQVYDEVMRNREAKIKDAFKTFEIKQIQFPAFCKGYAEYGQFNNDYKDVLRRYKTWKEKINSDIQNKTLPADRTIKEFFDASELISCDAYTDIAYTRYRIGNPPGKDNKYGDAVNWECLLDAVPNKEDLYFISTDKDYCSDIFDDMFNPFLANEWKQKKDSNIFFYKNLVPFLNAHFIDYQLITEHEKQELIAKLINSPTFISTHGIIAMMNKLSGWTESQIEDICKAAEDNNQVGSILRDTDVLDFFSRLLSKVNYEKLSDSATKRAMEFLFFDAIKGEQEARFDALAEVAESQEESYKH